eukprot:TRINITY_DN786_c3_g1_i1.p1 TRINITY_DN786_c3_g1~~TRINITY_DN786_c3_g1_i1.p1  ORF type:complete len:197 (+),score=39.58 TRINITY_DN786_c3_g1_i1:37-591(+)
MKECKKSKKLILDKKKMWVLLAAEAEKERESVAIRKELNVKRQLELVRENEQLKEAVQEKENRRREPTVPVPLCYECKARIQHSTRDSSATPLSTLSFSSKSSNGTTVIPVQRAMHTYTQISHRGNLRLFKIPSAQPLSTLLVHLSLTSDAVVLWGTTELDLQRTPAEYNMPCDVSQPVLLQVA